MVTIHDVYTAFVGSLPLNIRLLKEFCQLNEVEFLPKAETPLHISLDRSDCAGAGAFTCRIPLDYTIAPNVVLNHAYDREALDFFKRLMPSTLPAFTFVDIGANSGLVTREMIVAFPQIKRAFVYEPHPVNFGCLTHNLRAFHKFVDAQNHALSNETGSLDFYLDLTNSGNYSLNKSAIPVAENLESTISVSVKRAAMEADAWRQAEMPIFYMSDTQGHDEVIATDFDLDFWDSVFVAALEIWRIKKHAFEVEKFGAVLDRFPNKIFRANPGQPLSTAQVVAYSSGEDGVFADLVMWK